MVIDISGTSNNYVNIGSRRELFVDRYVIDEMNGVRFKLHEPRSRGVAVRYDKPWEGPQAFYTTVIKDEQIYRMYYRGAGPRSYTCYAESNDGVNWVKPELGLIEIDGSVKNNAIMLSEPGISFCPFKDKKPGIPSDELYKANARDVSQPKGGLLCYVSGDGIQWRQISEEPVVPYAMENNFDSQNVMFWSEIEGQYLLYSRHMKDGRRATAKATSNDFLNWTPQQPMVYSDTGTTIPSAHLYTNQTEPYFRAPHIYISLPGRIFFANAKHVVLEEEKKEANRKPVSKETRKFYESNLDPAADGLGDVSDGLLLTTRAYTNSYQCTFLESFVRPGIGLNNWTSRNNYPALGIVQTGTSEMSMYVRRNYSQKTAYLERMTLRLDGFSSINGSYFGGELITKSLVFDGKSLEINYSTSAAGSIKIELQDAHGRPVPGYALDDCIEIKGDEINRTVKWISDNTNPSPDSDALNLLAGTPVKLRFLLKDADLFSFRFGSG